MNSHPPEKSPAPSTQHSLWASHALQQQRRESAGETAVGRPLVVPGLRAGRALPQLLLGDNTVFSPEERSCRETIVLKHRLPFCLTRELPGCVFRSPSPDREQTGQLKPHTFIPHGLEAGHPRSRRYQGLGPPEASLLGLEMPPSPCDPVWSSTVCVCDLTPHRDAGPVGSV